MKILIECYLWLPFLSAVDEGAVFTHKNLRIVRPGNQGRLKVCPPRPWRLRLSLVCSRGVPLRDARVRFPCNSVHR